MSPITRILAGLAAAAMCGSAWAQDSFRVSILVLSERSQIDAPADFPASPQARALAPVGQAQRFVYAGDLDAAKRFYDVELRALGYRLIRTSTDAAVWERNGIMAALRFDPVVGTKQGTTLVRLTVSEPTPALASAD